jgi:hypothetical protein
MMDRRVLAPALVSLMLLLGACSKASGVGGTTTTVPTARPSSPAKLTVVAPKNGQVVKGSDVTVRLKLQGARIVHPTTQHITPTTGHIHVYLDNRIVSMNYGLTDTIGKVRPGTHVLRVEFVASDHLPFDPRVVSAVVFRVAK